MNAQSSTIACFGAAHWDLVGRMHPGFSGPDRPGSIDLRPGGVAANVALALAERGATVELLAVVGNDEDGTRLLSALRRRGVGTAFTLVSGIHPTGRYVAIEDEQGELTAAVADCGALDGLPAGAFDTHGVMSAALWFVETNLPLPVIAALAAIPDRPPLIANPVSPARAERLRAVLPSVGMLYCNRAEAEALCGIPFATSSQAAQALLQKGVGRAVITDGPQSVCDASAEGVFSAAPDPSGFTSATGAGDAFLARHLAAVLKGCDPPGALQAALAAAIPPS